LVAVVVLDAGLLIGLLDPEAASHDQATSAMLEVREARDRLLLPSTVLAELLAGAYRLGPAAVRAVEALVDGLIDRVCDVNREVATTAAGYQASHLFLRLPDALVLAVGQVLDADAVLTLDPQWSSVAGRVRVIG
jgi:predicted nucleic acid-binding protein